jgi:hypothetical protein
VVRRGADESKTRRLEPWEDVVRSIGLIVACIVVVSTAAAAGPDAAVPPAPPRTSAALPMCTVAAVETIDTVDSMTARVGDFFEFETVNAVVVRGRVVFPEHTRGWGIVTVAVAAGKQGRAGSLVMEPLYLHLADGRKIGVVLDRNASDLRETGQSFNAPGYLGAIPIVGIGAVIGAFDYFHHGKDITVPKGTLFAVFPSDDPAVTKCRRPPAKTT